MQDEKRKKFTGKVNANVVYASTWYVRSNYTRGFQKERGCVDLTLLLVESRVTSFTTEISYTYFFFYLF